MDNCLPTNGKNKNEKLNRICDITLIAIFLAFLFGYAIWSIILPDAHFSEQENRVLQQMPKLSSGSGSISEKIDNGNFLDRFFSGSYATDMDKYLSDQFPMRNSFVGIKAASEIAMAKGQNDDVVLGKNGYLFVRNDYPSENNLNQNIKSINAFANRMENLGIDTIFAVIGRNEDVETVNLPDLYSTEHSETLWNKLDTAESENGGSYVNLCDVLKQKSDNGEQVYYRTDHHWTTLGAYYAYREIITVLGKTPYEKDYFDIETATDSFYGTTWSSAGMKWIKPESIEYWRYDGDAEYTTVSGNREMSGFYDRSYLDVKDKYSAFLSGNEALVTIKAPESENGEEREKLLLVKDSFSHSLAPFLALHYDLYLLDPRYSTASVSDFIKENGIDKVLVIANISTLTDSPVMSILYS